MIPRRLAPTLAVTPLAPMVVALLVLAGACHRKEEAKPPAPLPAAVAPTPPPPPAAPPQLTGFGHDAGVDVQGYYIPAEGSGPKVGDYRLTNITLGAPSDFKQWEAGKRMATYGPVLMEFENLASPTQTNEMAAEVHAGVRVLPEAYKMDAGGVSFRGHAEGLGLVTFEGQFDRKLLAEARASGSGAGVVLHGILRMGDTEFRNVAFTYFAGD